MADRYLRRGHARQVWRTAGTQEGWSLVDSGQGARCAGSPRGRLPGDCREQGQWATKADAAAAVLAESVSLDQKEEGSSNTSLTLIQG